MRLILLSILLFGYYSLGLGSNCTTGGDSYILSQEYRCAPGFYCPNIVEGDPSTLPALCPPTFDCQLDRLASAFCEPQGVYEPSVCPRGYYCPTPQQKLKCPEGYFCPIGRTEPIRCTPMSSCPEGSTLQFFYGTVIIILIIDVGLFFIGMLYSWTVERKRARNQKKMEEIKVEALSQSFQETIQSSKFEMSFHDLGLALPDGNVLLQSVSGKIQAGKVTAIMGPSGAGKTTFLNVLMGKLKRTKGSLQINGVDDEAYHYRKLSGYVPQDDIMLRELTVRENIAFSAKVRLPSSWSQTQVDDHINAVIDALGLNPVQDSLIGDEVKRGISGGQRKRVNIGMELAACPLVLFLDEPTSGLDSSSALQVVTILKKLAGLGMTVVTVVHQPRYEIFDIFDDLILLSPGGQTAFFGPKDQAQSYFESLGFKFDLKENPADVLMDILTGKKDKDTIQSFEEPSGKSEEVTDSLEAGEKVSTKSQAPRIDFGSFWVQHLASKGIVQSFEIKEQITKVPENPVFARIYRISESIQEATRFNHDPKIPALVELMRDRGAPVWKQIWLTHNRSLLQQFRKKNSLFIEIFVGMFAGLLMGLPAQGDAEMYQSVLVAPYTFLSPAPTEWLVGLYGLLIGISVSLAGSPAGVKLFGEERVLYWREASAGHSRVAYYVGKTMASNYRFLLSALHFTALLYFLARPVTSFGDMFLIIWLYFFGVYGMATIVSFLTARENSALLAVVVTLFAGVFNGWGPSLSSARSWGISFLWDICYARWGTEAYFSQEASPFQRVYDTSISENFYGWTIGRFGMDIGIGFLIGFGYRVIGFFLMIFLNQRQQR